jgi:glucokinase
VRAAVAVAIDTQGEIVATAQFPFAGTPNRAGAQEAISKVISDVRLNLSARRVPLRAFAFADPGLVDTASGQSIRAVNIEGWERLSTATWFEQQTGLPGHLLTGPSARGYAEYFSSGPPKPRSLFHLQIDEAIGGGFIQEGNMFRGDTGCGMELGHIVVEEDGPQCHCGNRGCLEAVASLVWVRQRVAELKSQRVTSVLTREPFSIELWQRACNSSDKIACRLAAEVAQALGRALVSLIAILNPGVIVFSGALTALGPSLLDPLRAELINRCLPEALAGLQLKFSTLGETGTAYGAAIFARNKHLLRDL